MASFIAMTSPQSKAVWYLVQCKPRQDARAEENLTNQGFECFRPLISVEKRKKDKLVRSDESLFPGYLFVHLSAGDNWIPLRSTRGVSRLVSFNHEKLPTPVADTLIADLQARTQNLTSECLFQAGDRVRIEEGCFANVEAIFEQMDGEQRVMLLMNILGRQQLIRVPLKAVRPLLEN
jgi:transcriptional antiterminator RfaH